MKTRNPQDIQLYVEARNEAERVKSAEKRNTWEHIERDLMENHMGTKKLYSTLWLKTSETRTVNRQRQSRIRTEIY